MARTRSIMRTQATLAACQFTSEGRSLLAGRNDDDDDGGDDDDDEEESRARLEAAAKGVDSEEVAAVLATTITQMHAARTSRRS
jgi:N-acetylglucosamine-6-phosphate deacetylase